MPSLNLLGHLHFAKNLGDPFAHTVEGLRECWWRRTRTEQFLRSQVGVPEVAPPSYDHLIAHAGRAEREHFRNRLLPCLPFCPIASLGRRNLRAGTGFLKSNVRNAKLRGKSLHRSGPDYIVKL